MGILYIANTLLTKGGLGKDKIERAISVQSKNSLLYTKRLFLSLRSSITARSSQSSELLIYICALSRCISRTEDGSEPLLEVEAQKSMSAYRNKYNFPYLSRIDYASGGG